MGSEQLPPAGARFRPCVEALEDRSVPAGNVHVAVIGGVLSVTGDDLANQIWIAGAGKNSVVIRSTDGTTTINGQTALFVGGIKHGYNITMGGGDDHLLITGTRSNGALTVDMGDGNDVLGISDAGHRGATTIYGGSGNDTIILNGSAFRSYVYADTGLGDDTVIANQISLANLGLKNSGGSDFFDNRGSLIARPALIGFTTGARTTAPTPTVATKATDPTNATSLPFAVSFNEAVNGFSASSILVSNGTIDQFMQLDALTYVFTVKPTAQGPVSVSVPAGVVANSAGTANAASNTVSVTFDSVPPKVGVNAQTTNDSTPLLAGTVDDPTAAVSVVVNGQTLTATVTGNTWSVAVPTALSDGTYTVTATATDKAGNSSTGTGTLVVDTTPPSFTATNPPTVNFNAGAQTVANFATFTPAPNGGTTPTYTVSNVSNPGLFSVQPTVAANGTLSFTPVTGGFGSSTFAVSVSDGLNSSAPQTFTIKVDPVQGVSTTVIPGSTPAIDLSNPNWVTIPTVVAASNPAGIPAGTVTDGTRILDVTPGSGATVTRGAQVTVAYKGYLLDGTIFDQKTSIQFTADELHLIPGFAAGLIGMKVGGTRDIDISSYLAYGNPGSMGVPANSRLVFEVTVNSIS